MLGLVSHSTSWNHWNTKKMPEKINLKIIIVWTKKLETFCGRNFLSYFNNSRLSFFMFTLAISVVFYYKPFFWPYLQMTVFTYLEIKL